MRRVQDIAWPVIGLGAVAVSSWFLFGELRGLSFASLREAIASISLGRWASGDRFDLARLCCARLVRPHRAPASRPENRLAVRRPHLVHHLRDRAQHRRLGPVRGRHPLSGVFDQGLERRRDRASWSPSARSPSRLGVATLGGLLLLVRPDTRRALRPRRRCGSAKRPRLVLIAAPALYVVGLAPAFSPVQARRLRTRLSAPAGRGAAIARRTARTDRRGRHHLLRPAGRGQSRFPRRARRVSRLVLAGAGQPRARRTRGAGDRVSRRHAGHARRPMSWPRSWCSGCST